jgi:hypothetical protein
MRDTKREEFIKSLAQFLKIDIENSVSKEFMEVETAWVQEEWFMEFLKHTGTMNSSYKKPIEMFTAAIESFKRIKFQMHYNSMEEKTRKLIDTLQTSFRCFENTNPPQNVSYEMFKNKNNETGEKMPIFDKKQMRILEIAGDWNYLYGRRHDTYALLMIIENAYKKSIDKFIIDTALALGTAPAIAYEQKEWEQTKQMNPRLQSLFQIGA